MDRNQSDAGKAPQHRHDTHAEAMRAEAERLASIAAPEHGRPSTTVPMSQAGIDMPASKDDRKFNSKVGPLETERKAPHRRE